MTSSRDVRRSWLQHSASEVLLAIAAGAGETDVDFNRWHALQEYLAASPRAVVIPYARALAEAIPPVSIRLQRDFKALLSLVRAHALVHQETREHDLEDRIVATIEDYAAVRALVHELMAEGAEQTVPDTVRETVEALVASAPKCHPDNEGLSTSSIAHMLGIDRSSASRRLKRAEALGYVGEATGAKSGRAKRWVTGERVVGNDNDILPPPDALE